MENGFILPLEREIFIDQLKDIVDKAEDMLNDDTEGERVSALSRCLQQGQASEGPVREVHAHTHALILDTGIVLTLNLL